MESEDGKTGKDLLAFVEAPAPDGSRVGVRLRDGGPEIGVFHPLTDGKPLPPGAELIDISPPKDGPWREAETLYDGRPASGRPAMVNSRSYRSGWDAVFGGEKSSLN